MPRSEIQTKCHKCHGVGIFYKDTIDGIITTDPCPVCLGEKFLPVTYLDLDKFKTAFDQVHEKLDAIIALLGT